MSARQPLPPREADHIDRKRILADWNCGLNTHEIATALDLPECAVADVVRADREERARKHQPAGESL